MQKPLVSVIITTYNTGPYVAETLESVLRQTHPRWEIIVVDDGSTDDTAERIEPFRQRIHLFLKQQNQGPAAARNRVLSSVSGDYIAFLDSDDVWHPDKLRIQLEVASQHPESGMIACDGVQFDGPKVLYPRLLVGPLTERLDKSPDGQLTGHFYRELLQLCAVCCPAQTLIPRHVVDRVGMLTAARNEACDYDYYLRVAMKYPITLHRDSLVRWRYRPDSMSGPHERRRIVWALSVIPVLERHQSLCAEEDRPLVAGRISRLSRRVRWERWFVLKERILLLLRDAFSRLLDG